MIRGLLSPLYSSRSRRHFWTFHLIDTARKISIQGYLTRVSSASLSGTLRSTTPFNIVLRRSISWLPVLISAGLIPSDNRILTSIKYAPLASKGIRDEKVGSVDRGEVSVCTSGYCRIRCKRRMALFRIKRWPSRTYSFKYLHILLASESASRWSEHTCNQSLPCTAEHLLGLPRSH